MYLKSIELYGFKSFADRTLIEFNDSLTCIVGPNGSGKSNITDAIQWVLGEQSSLALRGESMSDVIFKGTEDRRALGLAEVKITFDNSSRLLDIDYETVEVRRKLYKNGDSSYFINSSPVRLKDIRTLFMDTGIGKDGYSIIGQGRIDSILNSKPIDRRAIFEEASGISKQKQEKIEAQRKLIKTQDNLSRIKDILNEIGDQRKSLEIQSQKAIEYKTHFSKLKEMDTYLSIGQIQKLESSLDRDVAKYEKNNQIVESLKKSLEEKEELQSKKEKILEGLEEVINTYQALNIEWIKKEKDHKGQLSLTYEKLNSNKKYLDEGKVAKNSLETSIEDLSEKISIEEKSLDEKIQAEVKLTKNLLAQEDENKIIQARLKKIEKEKISLENRLNEILIEKTSLKSKKDLMEESELTTSKDQKEIQDKLRDLNSNLQRCQNSISLLNEELITNKKNIHRLETNLSKTNKEINTAQKALGELQNEGSNLAADLSSKEARYSTLKNMEKSYEGYNRTIKNFFRFIKDQNINIPGLHGTPGDLIRVEPRYEEAIASVLGSRSQNIVVETFDSAKKIIQILNDNKLGRTTILPMDNLKTYRGKKQIEDEGFIGYGSDIVDYDKSYQVLVEYLLGNIIVVDSIDSARRLSKTYNKQAVSLKGEVINTGGSVSGGRSKYTSNIFTRKNDLKNLRIEIKNLKDQESKVEREYQSLRLKLEELSQRQKEEASKLSQSKESYEKLSRDIYEKNLEEKNLSDQVENTKMQAEKNQKSKTTTDKEYRDLNSKIEMLDKDFDDYKFKLNELEEKISDENLLLGQAIDLIQEQKINQTKISGQIDYIRHNLKAYKNDLKLSKTKLEESTSKISDLKVSQADLNQRIEDLEDSYENLKSQIEDFNNKFEQVKRDRKKAAIESKESLDDINTSRQEIFSLDKDLIKIKTSIDSYKKDIKNKREYMGQTYYITLLQDLSHIKIDSEVLKSYKKDIKNHKDQLSKLGNVDLSSIRAYDKINERYLFNKNQYDDMDKSRNQLLDLLKDISQVMEKKFTESFKTINEKFAKIFNYMFAGGSAKLVLTDEGTDQAGVDILVKLPGKKEQILSALSGGERSMTAVSLLFAFLETRPSPFSLLDEVDAALDEGNIGRFTSYLDRLDHIQFALITHRTSTMEAADYIYGITMEEPGVSKVVSLKFGEDD